MGKPAHPSDAPSPAIDVWFRIVSRMASVSPSQFLDSFNNALNTDTYEIVQVRQHHRSSSCIHTWTVERFGVNFVSKPGRKTRRSIFSREDLSQASRVVNCRNGANRRVFVWYYNTVEDVKHEVTVRDAKLIERNIRLQRDIARNTDWNTIESQKNREYNPKTRNHIEQIHGGLYRAYLKKRDSSRTRKRHKKKSKGAAVV